MTFVYRLSMAELPRPTDAELAILRVLWDRGPSTVRDVHAELARTRPPGYDRPAGYTSVLKVMQIMTAKGMNRIEGGTRYARKIARPVQREPGKRIRSMA